MTKLLTRSALALAAAGLFAGCLPTPTDGEGATITRLSKEKLQIGETLHFIGRGFPTAEEGETLLEFEGAYIWTDVDGEEVVEDVPSFTIAAVYDGQFPDGGEVQGTAISPGEQLLRWNRFGPYEVPFGGARDKPGIFKGTVTPIGIYDENDKTVQGQPLTVALEVTPSVLIKRLEPVIGASDGGPKTPNCDAPALRVFGGLPYIMEVETMGFQPEYFVYEISNINGTEGWTEFTHPAQEKWDILGDPNYREDEIVVFNGLPDDVEYALATIRVTAVDADNNTVETALPVPIVRPIGFFYDGKRHLAEYYEPVPVHGPIVGGVGTSVTYAESQSESRQRAVSVSFTRTVTESATQTDTANWSEGYAVTESFAETVGESRTDSEAENSTESYGTTYTSSDETRVELSSETGTDWGYSYSQGTTEEQTQEEINGLYGEVNGSVSTEVGGGVSVPGVANASGKVGTTVGGKAGKENSVAEGSAVGSSESYGSSSGGSQSEGQTYGSVTVDGESESISGSYGVSTQSSISDSRSETQATSESVTYDVGGAQSISEGYSVGSAETWSETWVSTTTQTNLLSFSGKVANGRCAMIYRQTVRYVRTAKMYRHDLCGVREKMADLIFNEWSWSPNIATDLTEEVDCQTEVPESTLPKAECYLACD